MATDKLNIGSTVPSFKNLQAVDGKKYSLTDFDDRKGLVIVFSCNHCPTVQAYEDRMMDFQREYGPRGFQLIAINSNETNNYPEDNFDEMTKRAKKLGFNFLYLRDDDQSVARSFGATHTPEFFVLDNAHTLRYHGKMDDNKEHSASRVNYVRDAADAILAGEEVKETETYSIGCTIKWK
ncbi:MAG TPA: thioredoxin family protein [Bacteroidota bacterium]|nr:thioredoxin family protein [Bacteroidota bacterium]